MKSELAAIAVVVSASLFGCKNSESDIVAARPAVSGAEPSARPPVDHLAPGELVEGKELAHGVLLPRDTDRIRTVPPSVYGRVRGTPAALRAYFEARVTAGKVVREPNGTILIDQAHTTDPKVALYIRIDAEPEVGARFEIRDATPPPAELHANDEERWKANGLKPNGAVDPTQLH